MREKYLMVQTLPRREMGPALVPSGDKTGDWCCRTILDPREGLSGDDPVCWLSPQCCQLRSDY